MARPPGASSTPSRRASRVISMPCHAAPKRCTVCWTPLAGWPSTATDTTDKDATRGKEASRALRRMGTTKTRRRDHLMTPCDDVARELYRQQFLSAFEQVAGRPLPEGFEDAEVEAYRQRGVPAAEAAQDFFDIYWQGGRLLP